MHSRLGLAVPEALWEANGHSLQVISMCFSFTSQWKEKRGFGLSLGCRLMKAKPLW